jgi:hypothetical protein
VFWGLLIWRGVGIWRVSVTEWMEAAACATPFPDKDLLSDDEYAAAAWAAVSDTRFIREPTPEEDDEWGAVCAKCPVFEECLTWADKFNVTGVYVAGEWRE